MPRRATCLLAVCTGLLAGCGGGGGGEGSSSDAAKDESDIRAAVTAYVSSMAAADGEAACAVLTEDLQNELIEAVKSEKDPTLRGKSCSELLNLVFRDRGGGQVQKGFEAAKKGRITNIEVKGDRATMISEASLGGRKVRIKYEAQRDGSRWLLSCCLASR